MGIARSAPCMDYWAGVVVGKCATMLCLAIGSHLGSTMHGYHALLVVSGSGVEGSPDLSCRWRVNYGGTQHTLEMLLCNLPHFWFADGAFLHHA